MQNSGGLLCPICLDYFIKPVTARCGHSFCENCIEQFFLFLNTCPVCQKLIRNQKAYPAITLSKLVEEFVKANDPQSRQQYFERQEMANREKIEKALLEFCVGQKVDIRDSNYIWREGLIIRIISKIGEPHKFIKIHYQDTIEKFQEDVKVTSERVARHGAYTSRTDIPKFKDNFGGMLG